nr:cytochrome c biogenesis protein CcdA [Desulfosporosinus sp.]
MPTRQKITRRHVRKKNYITSFFLGISLALVWTPCVGPILVSVLTVAATIDSSIAGSVLLTSYSLGMVIPLLALCLMFDKFPRLQRILKKYSGISLKVSGLFLILLGLLMYFDRLQILTNVF